MSLENLINKAEEIKNVQWDSSVVDIWKKQVLQFVEENYGTEYKDLLRSKLYSRVFHSSLRANQEKHIKIINNAVSFLNELAKIEMPRNDDENENNSSKVSSALGNLHREIYEKCSKLYEDGSYSESAEKGFKVVRDRLRALTGYETGSEAFGKGKLFIKGAAASNVEKDFNEAVKFLTMSIDFFRNEKAHTSDAKINDPVRAYEYLRLSSLAMNLLDQAEIGN